MEMNVNDLLYSCGKLLIAVAVVTGLPRQQETCC